MALDRLEVRVSITKLLVTLIVVIVPLSIVGLILTARSDKALDNTLGNNFKTIAEYRVAQRLQIASPLARAAAASLIWSGFLYARWKYGVDFHAASPEAAVGATRTPILLIHGLDDKNTPPLHSQVIASRRPNIDLWLVPGAGHTGAHPSRLRAEPRRRPTESRVHPEPG